MMNFPLGNLKGESLPPYTISCLMSSTLFFFLQIKKSFIIADASSILCCLPRKNRMILRSPTTKYLFVKKYRRTFLSHLLETADILITPYAVSFLLLLFALPLASSNVDPYSSLLDMQSIFLFVTLSVSGTVI